MNSVKKGKVSSKTLKRMREKCVAESNLIEGETKELQNDILSDIIYNGDSETNKDFSPHSFYSFLQKGKLYVINDDNVSGVFKLVSVPDLKSKFFIFSNIVTGTKTTYTVHSIKDLMNSKKSSFICETNEKESENYRKNRLRGYDPGLPCSKDKKKKK